MKSNVTALNRQNVFDIALQEYGNVQSVFDVALSNNISMTSELAKGSTLVISDSEYINEDILNFYKARKIKPATYGNLEVETSLLGIGVMKIGGITNKFIIR